MAIQSPFTFSRASDFGGDGAPDVHPANLCKRLLYSGRNGRDTDGACSRAPGSARRIGPRVPRALRPDAADPPLRGGDPAALPEGRGARHDAPRPPGRRPCRSASAPRSSPTITWPAPTAGTDTRSRRAPSPRRSPPRCSAEHGRMRRPRGLDERHRPGPRARRLLRDRRRKHRRRHGRGDLGAAAGQGRGRVLRRRRLEPGVLPRVPQLGAGVRLPVVYVCENNFYGEFTPMAA